MKEEKKFEEKKISEEEMHKQIAWRFKQNMKMIMMMDAINFGVNKTWYDWLIIVIIIFHSLPSPSIQFNSKYSVIVVGSWHIEDSRLKLFMRSNKIAINWMRKNMDEKLNQNYQIPVLNDQSIFSYY